MVSIISNPLALLGSTTISATGAGAKQGAKGLTQAPTPSGIVGQALDGLQSAAGGGSQTMDAIIASESNLDFAIVDPQDWHKIYPFQFQVIYSSPESSERVFYTLPIPPDSYSIKMHTASDATPTLGGVVEETSQNKIWMITLAGTTGIAVSRDKSADAAMPASVFRRVISTTGLLSGVEGAATQIAGLVGGIAGAQSVAGGLANIFQTSLPYGGSSVNKDSNGYSEIHRLHRFLYLYSVLAERAPDRTKLVFVNYKDRQQFNVVVKDFTVQKSAAEPYLYRYRIALKGWAPTGVNVSEELEVNRYANDLKAVNTLNLTGTFSSLVNLGSSLPLTGGISSLMPTVI